MPVDIKNILQTKEEEIIQYHSQCANKCSQEVVLVELCGTLVFIEHGKAKFLDFFKVVVHLELHSKHRIQVVHSCFSASQLKVKKQGERINNSSIVPFNVSPACHSPGPELSSSIQRLFLIDHDLIPCMLVYSLLNSMLLCPVVRSSSLC